MSDPSQDRICVREPWATASADDILGDLASAIERGRAQLSGPPIGHPDNPYTVAVPGWYEDRCIAAGTTAQEVADRTLRYATKVEVVR